MGLQDFKTEEARSTRINVLWMYTLAAYGGRAIADALLPHGGVHRKTVRFNTLNLDISESVWLGLSSFLYNIHNIIIYNTLFV